MAEERKFERKREREAPKMFDVEAKAKEVLASKMPEAQKQAYLKELGLSEEVSDEGKMSFAVYAKIRRVELTHQKGMLAFPSAKGIKLATLVEWDELFKKF